MQMITRLGHLVILGIIATAVVAVFLILSPDNADSPDDSQLPEIQVIEVVNFSRFGAIERIEVDGRRLTVRFAEDFDVSTTPLGTGSRVFRAMLDDGDDIRELLEAAGITVGDGGVQVTGE